MSSSQPPSAGATPPPTKPNPPYAPKFAQLGGIPSTTVDVPICAVLIAIFLTGAVLNMTLWKRNGKKGHNFLLSAVVFYFCFARIVASILRIAWATRPDNIRISIAASILFNAGVLILFVVNLIFLQRLVRAYHPRFGWSTGLKWTLRFLYFGIFACFIMVITTVPYGYFTLDQNEQLMLRDIRRVSAVYMAILAFIPLPGSILCFLWPTSSPVDRFGTGSMSTKFILLSFTTVLLALGAGFRGAIAFMARPIDNPGWMNHKASYYGFNYAVEIIVVFTYTLSRFDKRFHIPDKCKGPGDYSRGGRGRRVSLGDEEAVLAERRPTAEEERRKAEAWDDMLKQDVEQRQAA